MTRFNFFVWFLSLFGAKLVERRIPVDSMKWAPFTGFHSEHMIILVEEAPVICIGNPQGSNWLEDGGFVVPKEYTAEVEKALHLTNPLIRRHHENRRRSIWSES